MNLDGLSCLTIRDSLKGRTRYISIGRKNQAMNERQLKLLFCDALRSGHIKNNDVIPTISSY